MDDFRDGSFQESGQAAQGASEIDVISAAQVQKIQKLLRVRLGDDVYSSWFERLVFDRLSGATLHTSVPVKFLRSWIQSHYSDDLLTCCRSAIPQVEKVDVQLRTPAPIQAKSVAPAAHSAGLDAKEAPTRGFDRPVVPRPSTPIAGSVRTQANGFEGSPLDPRYTFDNYIVGPSNRMAHAAAIQVAETVFADERGFNPLFLHSAVGLGKSHLLHAIAWEVKRRTPNAQVLYLTAERFLFTFVEALKAQDAMAFKDRFRSIDILLIDDLEFMQGEKTEQEFEHIVNALLDGGRQVVVASARPPAQIERLNERMRSRLSRGLVTEISALDSELRMKILERRVAEKRAHDPLFEISRPVLEVLADRLTESGRELEGAVNRLYASWTVMRQSITVETAETIIRDLLQGIEPRRVKIDDILRIVSRHYSVSKADILSQRRHRSVVWPRQIGMYLAKQLTSRSLPEIGRRFGDRDHTTVLHAIRKIDKELEANARLREELEELKKQLNR